MPRLRTLALSTFLTGVLAAAVPAFAAPDDVVAKVGSAEITERDLNVATSAIGQQYGQLPAEQRRLAVLSALIDIEALAQAAEAENLPDDPEVASQLAFERARTLHSAYFAQKADPASIDDATLRERYDQMVAAMPEQTEIHARHILLDSEDAAKDAIQRLNDGADFAELAKELSTGPTGAEGGDLGFFARGQMVPAFEEAAFAMEPGETSSEPVQTQFGWHVIKVEEKRPVEKPSFEDMKPQLQQMVLRERYLDIVSKARESQPVEYVDPEVREQMDEIQKRVDGASGSGGAPAEAGGDEQGQQ